MKTEQVIQNLTNEVENKDSGLVEITKDDAKLILNHVNYLEGVAAALLKSQALAGKINVQLPYRAKPA